MNSKESQTLKIGEKGDKSQRLLQERRGEWGTEGRRKVSGER